MSQRHFSLLDRLCMGADTALRTITPGAAKAFRHNPADTASEGISETSRQHTAGLMRINHTGEVCAQALYQGQAATAKLVEVRESMNQAAEEEIDHLAWCEQRVRQLGSRPSLLNPAFYGLSFTIGALAGIAGDKYSLGFVAATEQQVCKHLSDHLKQLDDDDHKSRAILEQMLIDEGEHATSALEAGGIDFPQPVKKLMSLTAKVMTATTYRI
ncbi:ubiquinone biosynthesis monooxygenase Coq7 [Sinobacterium caligoides]|uniref:3-demethoxyubiquinol 3-hydroxylase n=1 Tax=Sinobacterium caligoides TaxID=933926 RepID=A0A3N2DNZ0_9GAMM|nr:2-polyprenyl-3-methyl-6-methoxy-1,4-benzoquinone monooxygenase [Sinobacterium caligoides]ROS01534.1 ubiquinone biosynthesis monooxygenase Coq7 [Sinobacterium caligoides]